MSLVNDTTGSEIDSHLYDKQSLIYTLLDLFKNSSSEEINAAINSISGNKITKDTLVVGKNVQIGDAEDSAGVTTIIGATVTTSYINALSVIAGSVAAENITGTVLTGKTIRTSAGNNRVELTNPGDPYAEQIVFYNGGTIMARIQAVIAGLALQVPFPYVFDIQNATTSICQFTSLGIIAMMLTPKTGSTYDLGETGNRWKDIYLSGDVVVSGNVDGVDISAHATNASAHHSSISSGLSITPADITSGNILPNSNLDHNLGSSSYYWNQLFLKFMEFYSYSTDPSTRTYGDMWHHYEGGAGPKQFRGCPADGTVYSFDMTVI